MSQRDRAPAIVARAEAVRRAASKILRAPFGRLLTCHWPIVVGGRLSGIVSIGDVVKSKLHESDLEVAHLRVYIHGAIV